jgi:protein-S-isoprenylcysteine O-methyltransferase Ste14
MFKNDLIFRVLLGIIIVTFVSHRAYYTRKYSVESNDSNSPTEPGPALRTASLLAVLGLLGTIFYIVIPSWMAWSSIALSDWLRWVGVMIALSGFGLLHWSQNTLGDNWSDNPHLMDGHQMVISGPYQWVRHPIYSSFLLILGSTFLISATWFIGGTWIMMMALDINIRIEDEEHLMISRYGDQYLEYMSRTGRFIPRVLDK